MGYYTDIDITVQNATPEQAALIDEEFNKMGLFDDCSGSCADGGIRGVVRNYDGDSDMKLLSARFPNVVFAMEGSGEDPNNRWLTYYKGGRSQEDALEIIRHKFDEAKLAGEAVIDVGQKYQYEEFWPQD